MFFACNINQEVKVEVEVKVEAEVEVEVEIELEMYMAVEINFLLYIQAGNRWVCCYKGEDELVQNIDFGY